MIQHAALPSVVEPRQTHAGQEGQAPPPVLWGLSALALHDAYWRGRGVQVVRLGRPEPLQRGAELYLLVEAEQMVLFDLPEVTERLMWRNASVTRLRVSGGNGADYAEQVVADAAGHVERVERHYRHRTAAAHRVLLTRRRRFAEKWMQAESSRSAWQKIRRRISWSQLDHWRCRGECFDAMDALAQGALLQRLVAIWPDPQRVITGITTISGDVTLPEDEQPDDRLVLIGPLWIGRGGLDSVEDGMIGPAWRADSPSAAVDEPAAPTSDAPGTESPGADASFRVRPISEIEMSELPPRRTGSPRADWPNSPFKRAIDLFAGVVGLVVFSPIFLLACLAIWLTDGRPIFFGHVRQTRGGQPFRCWKFRTMYRNADQMVRDLAAMNEADGPQFFIRNDPRVTRVGRILRSCQLDELPQLWNVLCGHMSLVGPRPSPDQENQYCPAWRDARLSVRPGITGLWQMKRTREPGTDFQEWIRYDMEYVERASLWLDICIIMQTVWAVLFGRQRHASE